MFRQWLLSSSVNPSGNIKLVFSSFKIGNMFGVKDPTPGGLRSRVVYNGLHVRAVMPVTSVKWSGIFPHLCKSI